MNITLYNNLSDYNVLNKTLVEGSTLAGVLKEPCNVDAPIITIENSGVINANYCYIDAFNAYYFINDQTILTNNHVRISCDMDVLQTFKNEIINLNVILDNETDGDKYLSDGDIFKSSVKTATNVLNFPYGFNDNGEYILITAGG